MSVFVHVIGSGSMFSQVGLGMYVANRLGKKLEITHDSFEDTDVTLDTLETFLDSAQLYDIVHLAGDFKWVNELLTMTRPDESKRVVLPGYLLGTLCKTYGSENLQNGFFVYGVEPPTVDARLFIFGFATPSTVPGSYTIMAEPVVEVFLMAFCRKGGVHDNSPLAKWGAYLNRMSCDIFLSCTDQSSR
jgi:hypothetical protein